MKCLALLVVCGGLLLAGCGGREDASPPGGDAATAKPGDQVASGLANTAGSDEPKTPIVRSLLDAIDDADAEDGDVKDNLRRILRESDTELSQVLGDNPRLSIERANQKAPVPVIGQP